jgi:predicted XRE-type DNA-binding protein
VSDLAQAKVMEMRAELIDHVRLIVQSEGWTQAQVAERFGVAQSRVSDLLSGKTEKFSLDMLITLASRIGCKVELAVE